MEAEGPEKVKIFLWRAAKNILPTAENLWKKKVIQEAICPVCRSWLENTAHALLDCKIARKAWRNSPLGSLFQRDLFPDVFTLLHSLHLRKSNISGDVVTSLLWIIWNARNNLLFKGKCEELVRSAAN